MTSSDLAIVSKVKVRQERSKLMDHGADEITVPEFIGPIPIWSQPPFCWLILNDRLNPTYLFTKSDGELYFLRFIAGIRRDPSYGSKDPIKDRALRDMAMVQKLLYLDEHIANWQNYLNHSHYPFALEYLGEYWALGGRYDDRGYRKPELKGRKQTRGTLPPDITPQLSYVGYALIYKRQRLTGLEEIVPQGPLPDLVTESLPSKSRTNRYFRFVKQSEAMG